MPGPGRNRSPSELYRKKNFVQNKSPPHRLPVWPGFYCFGESTLGGDQKILQLLLNDLTVPTALLQIPLQTAQNGADRAVHLVDLGLCAADTIQYGPVGKNVVRKSNLQSAEN